MRDGDTNMNPRRNHEWRYDEEGPPSSPPESAQTTAAIKSETTPETTGHDSEANSICPQNQRQCDGNSTQS